MKKTGRQFSPESIEGVCRRWEQCMNQFVIQFSDGSIPTLRNAEWIIGKKRVFVCEPDQDGKKKRGGSGPYFKSYASLNRTAARSMEEI